MNGFAFFAGGMPHLFGKCSSAAAKSAAAFESVEAVSQLVGLVFGLEQNLREVVTESSKLPVLSSLRTADDVIVVVRLENSSDDDSESFLLVSFHASSSSSSATPEQRQYFARCAELLAQAYSANGQQQQQQSPKMKKKLLGPAWAQTVMRELGSSLMPRMFEAAHISELVVAVATGSANKVCLLSFAARPGAANRGSSARLITTTENDDDGDDLDGEKGIDERTRALLAIHRMIASCGGQSMMNNVLVRDQDCGTLLVAWPTLPALVSLIVTAQCGTGTRSEVVGEIQQQVGVSEPLLTLLALSVSEALKMCPSQVAADGFSF